MIRIRLIGGCGSRSIPIRRQIGIFVIYKQRFLGYDFAISFLGRALAGLRGNLLAEVVMMMGPRSIKFLRVPKLHNDLITSISSV
jgi:hypothetical protein